MKRVVKPEGGFKWEKPGFCFGIGWPAGYPGHAVDLPELTEVEKRSGAIHKGATELANTQVTKKMRAGGLEALPSGRGTMGPLSARSEAEIAKSDRLRKGSM